MQLSQAISLALDGKAVLFTGAGFSFGALNEMGASIADAQGLSNRMLMEIGYPTAPPIPLSQASKSYQKKMGSQRRLISFLKKELCTVSIKNWHTAVCDVPWYKIYTTNFDDVLEYAYNEKKKSIDAELTKCYRNKKSMTSDQFEALKKQLQNKKDHYDKQAITTDIDPIGIPDNCIVHLNGYLRAQEVYSIENALRLSDESYLHNELPLDWQEHFIKSIRAAKAVIFIGYSGQGDYIIQKSLTTISNLKSKAIFITKENENRPLVDMLEDYGTVFQIGIENFSNLIQDALKHHITTNTKDDYLSFQALSRDTYKRSLKIPSSMLVSDLHRSGYFCNELLEQDTAGNYTLLLMRYAIENAKHDILRSKNTSIHIFRSGLGNGKTIASKMLINELLLDGIKVYKFVQQADTLKREIEEICRSKEKIVIVFENFYTHKDLIKEFCLAEDANVALVSTARTAVYENSLASLEDWTRGRFHYVYDVDRIGTSNGETEELISNFDCNALWGNANVHDYNEKIELIKKCNYQLKNIILETLHSNDITKRYWGVIEQIEKKQTYYKLLLFCIVKSMLAIDLTIDETLDLFKDELKGSLAFKRDENILELIDFGNSSYKLDSSIVAMTLFKTYPSLFENAVEVLVFVIQKCDKLSSVNNNFFELQKTLVSFRHIHSSFEGVGIDKILWYYDQIRYTDFCKNSFMFWIQYALAFLCKNDYPNAQRLINHSYQLIDEDKNYDTFQVDTIQAECWLDESVYSLTHIDNIEAYINTNQNQLLARWSDAHEKLILRNNPHSLDDVSKRYRLVKRYYFKLYNYIFKNIDDDSQSEVKKLMKSMRDNIQKYCIQLSDINEEISTLLNDLNKCIN